MILSDFWAECGRLLNDPNNSRWSQSVITTRCNLAQTEIQGYTGALKLSETITPTINQSSTRINTNTMDIVRASKTLTDGSIRPLPGISREELDFRYPDWQQWTSGEPLFFWFDETNQNMMLVPAPNSANVITNGITVWEIRKPTDLSLSSDIPFEGSLALIPYHTAITHWVVAYCWMDDADPESLAKSKFHKSGSMLVPGEYEKQVGRIMAEFDVPESVPSSILWQPQGGRVGSVWVPSKSNPLPWP